MSYAILSQDGIYRYVLTRETGSLPPTRRPICFIMLNPSTADAMQDDPTIRRCKAFAKDFECDELVVVNLFALRATDPKALLSHQDPVGPDNDFHIKSTIEDVRKRNGFVVAAWGSHKMAWSRMQSIKSDLGELLCLGTTKDESPRHPLYLRKDAPLKPWCFSKKVIDKILIS